MKKIWTVCFLMLLLAVPALAKSRYINIWIPKEAFSDSDVSIDVEPDDLRVTRYALYPWDKTGTRFSLFVEVENTSSEKIVIDETWLFMTKENRKTIAVLPYIFRCVDNVLSPGETGLLHAGAVPYRQVDEKAPEGYTDIEGMENFSECIRQAPVLCVRLQVRGEESRADWKHLDGNSYAEVRDGKIILNVDEKNRGDETRCQAILSDRKGRILDVLLENPRAYFYERNMEMPQGVLTLEKLLAPYVTESMIDGAVLDVQIVN